MRVSIEIDDDDADALAAFAIMQGLDADDDLPCDVDESCEACMAGEALRRLQQIGAVQVTGEDEGETTYGATGLDDEEIERRTAAVALRENRVAAAIRELVRSGNAWRRANSG
jgi:hypothetical protein